MLNASYLLFLRTCSCTERDGWRHGDWSAADPMTGRGNRNGTTSPMLSPADTHHRSCQHNQKIHAAPRRSVRRLPRHFYFSPAQFTPSVYPSPVNIAVAFLQYGRTPWRLVAVSKKDMIPQPLSLSLELHHSFKLPNSQRTPSSITHLRICSSLPLEATYHTS